MVWDSLQILLYSEQSRGTMKITVIFIKITSFDEICCLSSFFCSLLLPIHSEKTSRSILKPAKKRIVKIIHKKSEICRQPLLYSYDIFHVMCVNGSKERAVSLHSVNN